MAEVELFSWMTDEEVSELYNFLLPRVHAMKKLNGREYAVTETPMPARRAASFNDAHLSQYGGLRYEGTERLMPVEPPVNQASSARFPVTVSLPSPQGQIQNGPYQRINGQLQRALRFINPEEKLNAEVLDPVLMSSSMKSVIQSYRHNQAVLIKMHNNNESMLREHLAEFGPHLPQDDLKVETLYTLLPPQDGVGMNSSSSYGQDLDPASRVSSFGFPHESYLPVANATRGSLPPLQSVLNQASGSFQASRTEDAANWHGGGSMSPNVSSGLQLSKSRGERQGKDITHLGQGKRANPLPKTGSPGGPNGVSKKANGSQSEKLPPKYFPKAWEKYSQSVKDELAKLPPPVLTEETKRLAAAAEAADRKKCKTPRRRGLKPMPDIIPLSDKAVEVLLKAGARDNRPKAVAAREARKSNTENPPNVTTRARLSIAALVEGNEVGEEATQDGEEEK
ncbi:MAG: hypothetical protein Q9167_003120 [Letrouitia subvulpina]